MTETPDTTTTPESADGGADDGLDLPQNLDQARKLRSENKMLRERLHAAETAATEAGTHLGNMRRAEVERLAGSELIDPADLWTAHPRSTDSSPTTARSTPPRSPKPPRRSPPPNRTSQPKNPSAGHHRTAPSNRYVRGRCPTRRPHSRRGPTPCVGRIRVAALGLASGAATPTPLAANTCEAPGGSHRTAAPSVPVNCFCSLVFQGDS